MDERGSDEGFCCWVGACAYQEIQIHNQRYRVKHNINECCFKPLLKCLLK
jgi:hypothetical protein